MATKDRELRREGSNVDLMANAPACAWLAVDESRPSPVDETLLLARLRRGDRDAAGEFYDRYAPRIHRFISRALGGFSSPPDADDLLQETFLALAEALPFFRGDAALFTFACAIAHRKTMSFLRTSARRARIVSTLEPAGSAADDPFSRDATLYRALAALKPQYRELLHLKYVEEATIAEIATIVEATEHAVESKLKRARDALRRNLQERP
jgi:RNA polymerase sigma-70 factor (ECF subfamily)